MIKQLPKVLSLLLYISILGACKEGETSYGFRAIP